ncbi:MAG: ectoine/hydroxyectoine ABC transporter permease subunit EhuD [Gammaproteobacteria bacterium]|nr:ectoine/hydroxyectoine ABC transporter permease subunit EhuD [Gammaproteobacteria bacterium]NIR84952.1 ectoine/hydroxyectoine ABC transporter permease subunit EhuD [Gammaproteobacteria bacterium]NIR91801.1 ectoine/hydroxyectoine ABC transporter permease subunit EhuD [Gammaproteobacteria bacterium]NIU05999.1 ectoine/hydroxyectoine ABC transporter permease subunit EhuD [Gammaproteobacteria bacterium]NIV53046.1 ectoine/hydroxyectoine ABC transporter permease subunit EhuD [Gammaproteobacteria ba
MENCSAAEGFWEWGCVWDVMPALLRAAGITLEATITAYILALIIGLVLALLRRSPTRWISTPAREVIEFLRSTPPLVQIYFIYFGAPQLGLELAAWTAGITALSLHYSCYVAEVYRAGIEGVHEGQWEASRALNLSSYRTYRDIVLPQAIPPIVPALGNYLIGLFKDTPMLSVIAIIELMSRAKIIGSDTFRYVEPITMVGVFFLVMSLVASGLVQTVERRLKRLPAARASE